MGSAGAGVVDTRRETITADARSNRKKTVRGLLTNPLRIRAEGMDLRARQVAVFSQAVEAVGDRPNITKSSDNDGRFCPQWTIPVDPGSTADHV
jgi:hypothetical protein